MLAVGTIVSVGLIFSMLNLAFSKGALVMLEVAEKIMNEKEKLGSAPKSRDT